MITLICCLALNILLRNITVNEKELQILKKNPMIIKTIANRHQTGKSKRKFLTNPKTFKIISLICKITARNLEEDLLE